MPTKSKKQKRFMQAAAHNPDFAKRAGISQKVAREFVDADHDIARKLIAKKKSSRPQHRG